MRFTIATVAGLVAVASAATSVSLDPAQASQYKCIDACDAGDVKCQSYCISVPSPNDAQVNATNQCVGNCKQGSGSEADTKAYASCVKGCIDDNYWKTIDGTPRATGAAGSGSSGSKTTGASGSDSTATGTAAASDADSTNASNTDSDSESSSGTATGSSSSSTSSDSAAGALFVGSASLAGLLAAVLAL